MKKIIITVCIIAAAAAGILVYYMNNGLLRAEVRASIDIPRGSGDYEIIRILKDNDIIKSELMFKLNMKLHKNGYFKSGSAELSSKMSYKKIIDVLINGMDSSVKITIPEGSELHQIVDLFVNNLGLDEEKLYDEIENGSFDYDFISELPAGKFRLEGYLFPETYIADKQITEHEVLDMCLKQFSEVYTDEYRKRARELGFTTNQIITLASIIERECSTDRDIVSSVFHNRLKSDKFSYLESCSTVIYVTKNPKPRLTAEDIKVDSPYNTYINKGLPPGPIGSPGEESIKAALYPAQTDYYFFSDMGGGKNTFSKTYEEHLAKNRG